MKHLLITILTVVGWAASGAAHAVTVIANRADLSREGIEGGADPRPLVGSSSANSVAGTAPPGGFLLAPQVLWVDGDIVTLTFNIPLTLAAGTNLALRSEAETNTSPTPTPSCFAVLFPATRVGPVLVPPPPTVAPQQLTILNFTVSGTGCTPGTRLRLVPVDSAGMPNEFNTTAPEPTYTLANLLTSNLSFTVSVRNPAPTTFDSGPGPVVLEQVLNQFEVGSSNRAFDGVIDSFTESRYFVNPGSAVAGDTSSADSATFNTINRSTLQEAIGRVDGMNTIGAVCSVDFTVTGDLSFLKLVPEAQRDARILIKAGQGANLNPATRSIDLATNTVSFRYAASQPGFADLFSAPVTFRITQQGTPDNPSATDFKLSSTRWRYTERVNYVLTGTCPGNNSPFTDVTGPIAAVFGLPGAPAGEWRINTYQAFVPYIPYFDRSTTGNDFVVTLTNESGATATIDLEVIGNTAKTYSPASLGTIGPRSVLALQDRIRAVLQAQNAPLSGERLAFKIITTIPQSKGSVAASYNVGENRVTVQVLDSPEHRRRK